MTQTKTTLILIILATLHAQCMSSDKSNSFGYIRNMFDKFLVGYSLSYLTDGDGWLGSNHLLKL